MRDGDDNFIIVTRASVCADIHFFNEFGSINRRWVPFALFLTASETSIQRHGEIQRCLIHDAEESSPLTTDCGRQRCYVCEQQVGLSNPADPRQVGVLAVGKGDVAALKAALKEFQSTVTYEGGGVSNE